MTPPISHPREKTRLCQTSGRHRDGRHGNHLARPREENVLGRHDKDLAHLEMVEVRRQEDRKYLVDLLPHENVLHQHPGYHLRGHGRHHSNSRRGNGHHGNDLLPPIKGEEILVLLKEEGLVLPRGGERGGVRRGMVGGLRVGGGGADQFRIIGRDQTHLGEGIMTTCTCKCLHVFNVHVHVSSL